MDFKKALLIIAIAINLIPIWLVPTLSLGDYPSHLARARITRDYLLGNELLRQNFYINPLPVPNLTTDVFNLALSFFLNLDISGRLLLSTYAILLPLSILFLSKKIGGEQYVPALLGCAWTFDFFFLFGTINFLLSLPLFFFSLTYFWSKKDNPSQNLSIGLAFISIALYFTHLVACLVFMFFVVVTSLYGKKKTPSNLLSFIPVIAIAAIFFSAYLMELGQTKLPTLSGADPLKDYVLPKIQETVLRIIITPPLIFVSAILLLIFVWHCLRNEGAFKKGTEPIVFVALALLFIFLILPSSVPLWSLADFRLVPSFIFLFAVSLDVPKEPDIHLPLFLLSIALAISAFMLLSSESVNTSQIIQAKLPENSRIAPLPTVALFEKWSNPYSPHHRWEYYLANTKGSIGPIAFSYVYQPLRVIEPMPTQDWETRFVDYKNRHKDMNISWGSESSCGFWHDYYDSLNFTELLYYDYLVLTKEDICNVSSFLPSNFSVYYQNDAVVIYSRDDAA